MHVKAPVSENSKSGTAGVGKSNFATTGAAGIDLEEGGELVLEIGA